MRVLAKIRNASLSDSTATLTVSMDGAPVDSTQVTIGGKPAATTFKDMNTLTVTTPQLTAGPQQILITNPDGETATLDAALTAS